MSATISSTQAVACGRACSADVDGVHRLVPDLLALGAISSAGDLALARSMILSSMSVMFET
jgi:hypothetical protein